MAPGDLPQVNGVIGQDEDVFIAVLNEMAIHGRPRVAIPCRR